MANYIRLSEGLNSYKLIPSNSDIWDHIKTNNKDYYISIFNYNEDQYKQWKSTGSVAGIKDVTTNKLFWDFDYGQNLSTAKEDAATLVTRLIKHGIKEDNIQIAFSGQKGFSIQVDTNNKFTPEEFKNVTFALANDLKTFDKVVNDPNRIVRVVGTKHNKSGLFKIPLTANQLSELQIDDIKRIASSIDDIDTDVMNGWHPIELPDGIFKLKTSIKSEKKVQLVEHELDMSLKPKWLSEVRYAIQEGYFPTGEGKRNHAFMILASTYKKQGFNKQLVYRMLKGVAEVQAQRNNSERYPDKELWSNVVEVVFSPNWKGGIYKDSEDSLLVETAQRLGLKIKNEDNSELVNAISVSDVFKRFAQNIDKNTIKLGIDIIDENITVTTSMLVGLLAAPSAGKTSISLSVLNSNSLRNINSIFFSLDMGAPLVFQRLIQKHTGFNSKKIFEFYKNNDSKTQEFSKIIDEQYKNVKFCFRSGVTVDDIKQYIIQENEKLDNTNKIKLIVIDYLECLVGPYSDPTANTGLISQQLKDLANELELTVLLLLQPQKHAGDPSDELLSYRKIKGSSAIEQAASIILTLWRPGFSPQKPEDDRYMTIAAVKNRMGQLGSFDFGWEGLRGDITELDELEKQELNELRKIKQLEKAASNNEL